MMKKLLALLLHPVLLKAAGLVALALVVWHVGPLVSIAGKTPLEPEPARWAVIGALVLAFVLRGTLWPDKLGPRLPAAFDQHIWLVSQDALQQFDAQGQRLQSLPLRELGIGSTVSSLQFTAPDVAFVHDAQGVRRCLISQKTCTTLDLPGLQATPGFRWVRVAADEGEIVVSDTAAHRILV